MGEYYIGPYHDHYAIFDSMGRVQTQYDTHAEAKADLDSYNKTGKPLPEVASKDSVIDKAFKGPVNSMFDTTSKEFKKVGNDVGNDKKAKQTWWNDMKLTARMHKKPYPKINGYTNGDFKPNHEWLMAAIDQCRSVTDCECLIKDAYLGISQDKQLVKNLQAVKEGNPSRYVNVKLIQKRLDNGVTPEKVEKHIEWMKENYIKGLQAKKKEFKKSQNESTNDVSMNEDHSEISNDPEMEKLLALAGCTIEDLDTINNEEDIELDDDDPIDANTSREIDAVMDESAAKSEIDKDFVPKEKIKLSSLKKIRITEELINKYKKDYPVLRHVRCKDTKEYICDGYMWMNHDDKLVCYVGSCEYTDDHTKWIVSLEIIPEFKGHGLSKQILDFATKTMNCKYLSVNKDNKLAKSIYDKYGFKVYTTSDKMYYMTIDPKAKINESLSISHTQKYMKKQNESVVEDMGDLDFIMESIFMDIDN